MVGLLVGRTVGWKVGFGEGLVVGLTDGECVSLPVISSKLYLPSK